MKSNSHNINPEQLVFLGTCSDPEIANIAEKSGRKFSYKRCCKLIKEQFPELHYDLALELYNPWEEKTSLIKHKGRRYLCFVHSQIDHVFYIDDGNFKIYK